jgi:hypothetical protein
VVYKADFHAYSVLVVCKACGSTVQVTERNMTPVSDGTAGAAEALAGCGNCGAVITLVDVPTRTFTWLVNEARGTGRVPPPWDMVYSLSDTSGSGVLTECTHPFKRAFKIPKIVEDRPEDAPAAKRPATERNPDLPRSPELSP